MTGRNPPGTGIAARVARGASLSVIGTLGTRMSGILTIAVLGRLLLPEDFGIVAMAMLFIGLSEALMSRQFDLALIRSPDLTPAHFHTAFTLSLLWGGAMGAALHLGAEPAARLFGEPDLAPVLRWLSLAPLIEGLRNPRFVEFERGLSFGPDIVVNLLAKLLQALIAITLALLYGDHRALIGGFLAFGLSRLFMGYLLMPWWPGFSLVHARAFLGFGGWLSGTGLMGFLMQKSDTALISAKLGPAEVGVYNLGSELTLMTTSYLAIPVSRTIYPGLAAVAASPARLAGAFRRAQEMLMGLLLPVGIGTGLLAPEIVVLLVGPGWETAIPVLQVLAPVTALSLLVYNIQSIVMVEGATRDMFRRNLAVALVQVPLIAAGLWGFGLAGALAARAAATGFHVWLTLRIGARLMGGTPAGQIAIIWRSLAASAAMAAGLLWLGAGQTVPQGFGTALAGLAAGATTGGAIYAAVHLLLWLVSGRPDGFETAMLGAAGRVLRRLLRRFLARRSRNAPELP